MLSLHHKTPISLHNKNQTQIHLLKKTIHLLKKHLLILSQTTRTEDQNPQRLSARTDPSTS